MTDTQPTSQIPKLGTSYLHALTDDFSIWQHTDGDAVETSQGYALDDAARGVIAALVNDEFELARTYLRFIYHACCDFPEPVNFFSKKRQPEDRPMSHDALGEVWWALSVADKYDIDTRSAEVRNKLQPHLESVSFLRSLAYAAIGCDNATLMNRFVSEALESYAVERREGWDWLEDTLKYGNAVLPWALIETGLALRHDAALSTGLATLDFLNATCTHQGAPIAIGNKGWYPREGKCALWDQQPIDPAYQVCANVAAYRATTDGKYLAEAERFLSWFWGNNLRNELLVDPVAELVHDGLREADVSPNAGAENTVCYLIAQDYYFRARSGEPENPGATSRQFLSEF